jgi:hypothetical protein
MKTLKSKLDRYGSGDGPLTLDYLHSIFPQSDKARVQDVGEILTLIFSKTLTVSPRERERFSLVILIDPGPTLYSSLQNCLTWNYSQDYGNKATLIFQINRVAMTGQKETNRTTYPIGLNLKNCQPHKGKKTGIHHSLKSVVVHKGDLVDEGHYVVYIQPSDGKSWALFDDQTVKWVKEEEVLRQEVFLLIYSWTPPPILFDERKGNQPTNRTGRTH